MDRVTEIPGTPLSTQAELPAGGGRARWLFCPGMSFCSFQLFDQGLRGVKNPTNYATGAQRLLTLEDFCILVL